MMPIKASGVEVTNRQRAALQRGLQRMGLPSAEVCVTANFEEAIRVAAGLSSYVGERLGGVVGGKAIGEIIFINGSVIEAESDFALERLAAHEAGHLILNRMGEGWSNASLDIAKCESRSVFVPIASTVLDEIRIERSLGALKYQAPHVAGDYIIEHLDYLNDQCCRAVAYDVTPAVMQESVSAALGASLTYLGYVVAATTSGLLRLNRTHWCARAKANWREYCSPWFSELESVARDVPLLEATLSAAARENLVRRLGSVAEAHCRSMGFEMGSGFIYRTAEDHVWVARMDRSERFAESLGEKRSSCVDGDW